MRFDHYYPIISFFYFVSILFCTIRFDHPICIAITLVAACIYTIRLNGFKKMFFCIFAIAVGFLYAIYYSSYQHFGITTLAINFVGNEITLESILYGVGKRDDIIECPYVVLRNPCDLYKRAYPIFIWKDIINRIIISMYGITYCTRYRYLLS